MKMRLPYYDLCPNLTQALRGIGEVLENSSLGVPVLELVNMRISQINGCAFCLEMHGKALRATGESPQRLDTLAGWRESRHFTEKERAAIDWAESLTHISTTHAPDATFEPLKQHFTDQEIAELTFAIINMNALNRLAIGMRRQ